LFAGLYGEVERLYPGAPEKLKFNEVLKRVLDRLVSDLISNSYQAIERAGVNSADDVRRLPQRLIAFSAETDRERRQIKTFLYANLYDSPVLRADQEQGEQVIADLFTFFMGAPDDLPGNYQAKTQHDPLHRVVCDYIAGMTDNYVQEQHRRFCQGARLAGAGKRVLP
jgi:dGTPase